MKSRKTRFKEEILRFIEKSGYSISKAPVTFRGLNRVEHDFERTHLWLMNENFHSIIDIGANAGQFAEKARALFPNAKIHSFEPIPELFEMLKKKFSNDKLFEAYPFALGMTTEKGVFNRNDFSDSSSFLKMESRHFKEFPRTKNTRTIEVDILPLDNFKEKLELSSPYLVKIDVQGFEDKVIKGGEMILANARMILIEVGFESLYQGQPLFEDIYFILSSLGFKFRGVYEQLCSPVDGRILQADAVFVQ